MADGPRILLHTCGDHAIGLGHVGRSLALAEALKVRLPAATLSFRVVGPPEVVARVSTRGFSTTPDAGAEILVVDVPKTDPALFREARGMKVSIDEPGPARYEADLAIGMLYEPKAPRPAGSRTTDLRGLEYIPLNPDYRGLPTRRIGGAERVLVVQGGSDTYGMTPKICAALRGMSGGQVDVVLGPAFQHDVELGAALAGDGRFRLHRAPPTLKPLMDAADLAVSAAGVTSLELAASGVPMILVVTEGKEAETAGLLARDGAAVYIGGPDRVADGTLLREVEALRRDAARREALSRRAQAKIDGNGAARVADAIGKAWESRTS